MRLLRTHHSVQGDQQYRHESGESPDEDVKQFHVPSVVRERRLEGLEQVNGHHEKPGLGPKDCELGDGRLGERELLRKCVQRRGEGRWSVQSSG